MKTHKRYYQIGGFTIEVNSEIPFQPNTFHPKFKQFEVDGSGVENIIINHYFDKAMDMEFTEKDTIYVKKPWAIYQKQDNLIYEWIQNHAPFATNYRKFVTNKKHTKLDTYNNSQAADFFSKGMLETISLFPTDQILLSQALAFKQGCIMHSLGLIHNNQGYLFIGHSGAGKSTMAKIMQNNSIILCDDRNIIRKTKTGFNLFGTWRHSDFHNISPLSAPLKAIFFLNQSDKNQLEMIRNNKIKISRLLECLIKPFATSDWWELTLDFFDDLVKQVDCINLKFDKSGKIRELIGKL